MFLAVCIGGKKKPLKAPKKQKDEDDEVNGVMHVLENSITKLND